MSIKWLERSYNKILSNIQTILFKELSIALNTLPEVIFEKINSMIESTDRTPIPFN